MTKVVNGSILDFRGDAIVNPANSFLRHSGGLAAVIDAAATQAYTARTNALDTRSVAQLHAERAAANLKIGQYHADHDEAPLIATGNAVVTSAGVLPYKGIIHAVGPIWNGGGFIESDLLELTMDSVLAAADARGWRSIAVPAISCGVFGYPVVQAAAILTQVAEWWVDGQVTFYVMGDEHFDAFNERIS